MSNPFETKFKSACQNCEDIVDEGEDMYVVDGLFVCRACANAGEHVCECGKYKKEEYDKCYDCFSDNQND